MIATRSPFDECPVIAGHGFHLRLVEPGDAADLLRCYADPQARALFNDDNCTNAFCYDTIAEMQTAIEFWLAEYRHKYYVRFAVIDQADQRAIGTIEVFTRPVYGGRHSLAVLRLDLYSPYETAAAIDALMGLIEDEIPVYFRCDALITKLKPAGIIRREVFKAHGYIPVDDPEISSYPDYFISKQLA